MSGKTQHDGQWTYRPVVTYERVRKGAEAQQQGAESARRTGSHHRNGSHYRPSRAPQVPPMQGPAGPLQYGVPTIAALDQPTYGCGVGPWNKRSWTYLDRGEYDGGYGRGGNGDYADAPTRDDGDWEAPPGWWDWVGGGGKAPIDPIRIQNQAQFSPSQYHYAGAPTPGQTWAPSRRVQAPAMSYAALQ